MWFTLGKLLQRCFIEKLCPGDNIPRTHVKKVDCHCPFLLLKARVSTFQRLGICGCYAFFQIIYLSSYFYLSAPCDLFCHWLPRIANAPRTIPIKGLSHEQKIKVENEGGVSSPTSINIVERQFLHKYLYQQSLHFQEIIISPTFE